MIRWACQPGGVPRFEPFPALRYAPTIELAAVVAPPYDVVSEEEVLGLAARDEHNIVHVDVPRGPDRYDAAGRLLRQWMADGVMVADDGPTFTLYRMRFRDEIGQSRNLVGVVGALEVVDDGAGGVLPHERTTPKASTDRLDLTRATEANLSPVWALSLADGLTQLLEPPAEPVGAVVVDDVEHVVERVTDRERLAVISATVGGDDVLLADGHHRYGVSRTYRDEVRERTGRTDTPAEATLAFIGELVGEQLSIDAIHRLYGDIGFAELRALLAESFDFAPAGPPGPDTLVTMVDRGCLVLVGPDGSAEWMTPRPGVFDHLRAIDGEWLEHALTGSSATVTYQHGLDETVGAVRSGHAAAAVLTRPVSLDEIERTARERLLMPPKSTFFTPKLRTGLVLRDLREG
jgi:uncharacterized protein (DUF1015 family)